jgi:hypothetical protein
MDTINEENKREWLLFIEFIRRKYGFNSADYIRLNDYNNSGNQSVATYYYNKYPDSIRNPNVKLQNLLQDTKFIALFDLNNPVEISKFTEIYNETDYLMNSLNNTTDNLYIKCNPVDDNGISIEGSNNSYGPNLNSLNSMLTEGSNFFDPKMLYNNIGLQVFISILFVGVIYGIGNFLFVVFPSNYTKRLK